MMYLVKVRVNRAALSEFGQMLQKGELDRSCIRGETYCIKNDPAAGYSIWEAKNRDEFEKTFSRWKRFYEETEVTEVISPREAMTALISRG